MPPMGKGKQGVIRKPKNTKKTAKRLFSYFKEYKFMLFIVVLAVIVSSGANVLGTYLLKPVINDYIVPFIGSQNPDLSGFIQVIVFMLVIYVIGALSSWVYNRIMVSVSCGVLYKVRNQMFEHMQRLPIK